MAIKEIVSETVNVVEASTTRILNVFKSGVKVALSMSGGKDSICLANLLFELIQSGKVDPKQLTVQFIDEEAIFDDVEQIVKDWRKKFMLCGAEFEWYCIQTKHYNCLNSLSDEETFITWDERERANWVRKPPSFAIMNHKILNERTDSYQDFLMKLNKGRVDLVGIRTDESLMRRNNIARMNSNKDKKNSGAYLRVYPIYDWRDDDVWLYIKKKGLEFPKTYMNLYQIGAGRREMRISQFFSIDTAKTLVSLNEFQPDLMKRVIRREPNAYIASMYWESEMFRRKSRTKKSADSEGEKEPGKDYKKIVLGMLSNIPKNFESPSKIKNAEILKKLILRNGAEINASQWHEIYGVLIAGDPKQRAVRGLYTNIRSEYSKREAKNG